MGSCCTTEKVRYTFLPTHQPLPTYEIRSSNIDSSTCRICNKKIIEKTVLAKCNYCNICIGHASCVFPDQVCIICKK